MGFDDYKTGDNLTCKEELHNTLVLFDILISDRLPGRKIKLNLVGGSAFAFYGFGTRYTYDIDTANTLRDEVRTLAASLGISDNAADVVNIPSDYEDRVKVYPHKFKNLLVNLPCYEDLLITKLGTGRERDMEDLQNSGILNHVSLQVVKQLIRKNSYQSHMDEMLRELDYITSCMTREPAQKTCNFAI